MSLWSDLWKYRANDLSLTKPGLYTEILNLVKRYERNYEILNDEVKPALIKELDLSDIESMERLLKGAFVLL